MSTHPLLEPYLLQEHPSKKILQQNGISVPVLAKYLGISVSYAYQLLSGAGRFSREREKRLQRLIEQLNNKGGSDDD